MLEEAAILMSGFGDCHGQLCRHQAAFNVQKRRRTCITILARPRAPQ
jgi:hypothetical protein